MSLSPSPAPSALKIEIDAFDDVTIVTPLGVLSVGTAPQLRNALMKCVTEQPAALIVDLRSVVIRAPATLTLFGMVARRTADWASVRLVIVAASLRDVHSASTATARFVDVCPTLSAALEIVGRGPTRRVARRRVSFDTPNLTWVRTFVASTCHDWAHSPLADDASLIAYELVTNAIRHARTDAVLRLELRPQTLIVAVSDRDSRHPMPVRFDQAAMRTSGYGLAVVAGLARCWGTVPVDDGKIVWAALAA